MRLGYGEVPTRTTLRYELTALRSVGGAAADVIPMQLWVADEAEEYAKTPGIPAAIALPRDKSYVW